MPTIFLESKDNPKIKHLRGLIEQNSYRKKQGQTVLEGTHLCLAWLAEDRKIKSIFTTEQALNHPDFDRIAEQYQGADDAGLREDAVGGGSEEHGMGRRGQI